MFCRVATMVNALDATLNQSGYTFARNERLGYLGSHPSNVGTCMVATVVLRIPRLSSREEFPEVCRRMKVEAKASFKHGSAIRVFDISNTDRLGTSEVEQLGTLIDACRVFVQVERSLKPLKAPSRGKPNEAWLGLALSRQSGDAFIAAIIALRDRGGRNLGDEEIPIPQDYLDDLDESLRTRCFSPQGGEDVALPQQEATSTQENSSLREGIQAPTEAPTEVDATAQIQDTDGESGDDFYEDLFSDMPGLGSQEYPGFPADQCPCTLR